MREAVHLGAYSRVKRKFGGMKIGQLAKTCGVSSDTIRFYEKLGLLPRSSRQSNGYRSFDLGSVGRLKFIRSAQALGFSLSEVALILPRVDQSLFTRADLELELAAKIQLTETHIQKLERLKSELLKTLSQLGCKDGTPLDLGSVTRD